MGDYVDLGPVRTWYDEQGPSGGDPVVLLHGGMVDAGSWALQAPALAERHHVFVPERRGHGHTPDVEGPFTYEDMAEETVAFVERVVGRPAHLVGWSDGGNVGLLVAIARPDLVDRLVVMGANYHHEGLLPGFSDQPEQGAEDDIASTFRASYAAVSPDGPEHWPVVSEKLRRMWREGPTMTVEDLGRIAAPTLVLVGDDDVMSLAHTVSLYESLPKGQLAVIPGASHVAPVEKADLVNRIILDFLTEEGEPVTMAPMRRA